MNVSDLMKQVAIPLVVSSVLALGGQYVASSKQAILLEQNIKATSELSKAVTDLRLQMAIFGEKYVTREELKRELKEVKNGA